MSHQIEDDFFIPPGFPAFPNYPYYLDNDDLTIGTIKAEEYKIVDLDIFIPENQSIAKLN